ncbi:MAG TPA: glycine cleavage system protein GcvH [Streptosporangiaceae bacterium]|jgi:glycine cleavage system H protein
MRHPHPPPPAAGPDRSPGPAAGRAEFAVSAGIGPVPAVLVTRPPAGPAGPDVPGLLGHALARALHLAGHRTGPGQPCHDCGGTMTGNPADLRYSSDHLWARPGPDGSALVRVGVTEFAQQSLGDVVEVTLPGPGERITAGEPSGEIESVKAVNDLVTPVTGTVRGHNDALADAPGLVNSDPYGDGWLMEVEVDPGTLAGQLASLLDEPAYAARTRS